MSDLLKRIMATRLLRDIFIISLIVAVCSTIITFITLGLWDLPVIPEAAGVTVSVLVTAFDILGVVVIVMIATTFALTINLNNQCKYSFFLAIFAALLMILSSVFQFTLPYRLPAYIVNLVGELLIAVSLYALLDGLFNHELRRTLLMKSVGMGCTLMLLSSAFLFLAFGTKVNAAFTTMFYTLSLACTIAYSIILLICMNSALKDSREKKVRKELEESEAL